MVKKVFSLLCIVIIILTPILGGERFFIAPFTKYQKFSEESLTYHVTTIELPNPLLEISTVVAKTKLSQVASEEKYDLIINGNFFDTQTREPVGLVVKNGELIHLPIKRGVFGITFDGTPIIDIFNINVKIKIENTIIPVNSINSPRGADQVTIFTNFFGTETKLRDNASAGIDIEITLNDKIPSLGSVSGKVSGIYYGVKKSNLKDKSCIISIGGTALRYLPYFSVGKDIEIIVETSPQIPLKEAVCGGPILLKDGNIVLGKTDEASFDSSLVNGKNPRTIIGIAENKIYFIVIEGRNDNSQGLSLPEACNLLKGMDIKNAINLDGGGSSLKIIWGKPVNQTYERIVPVGLGIKNLYPFSAPKILSFKDPDDLYIKRGDMAKLELLLQDENYHTYTLPDGDISWTVSTPIINFDIKKMSLEAKDLGECEFSINLGDLNTKKNIFIWDFTAIVISSEKNIFYIGEKFTPQVYAIDNFQRQFPLDLKNIIFDTSYIQVENNYLICKKPGETILTYTFNGLSTTYTLQILPVQLQDNKIIEDFEENKGWAIRGINHDTESTYYTLTSQAFSGNSSLKWNYGTNEKNSFIYLDLKVPLPQETESFSIAVKGKGKGWLRVLFYDAEKTPWTIDLTSDSTFSFPEWTILNKSLKELKPLVSTNKISPTYPLTLNSIYIVNLREEKTSGEILLDSLQFH
ncbi:MAG TPA: phosphodiester glycosidase family protein [Dictyoglomaceae bacterium]|nr:phosphodiester glycosidase family protein [Dictyoglomaceae bacterium]HPU42865.1 phosphodiester glycosidase family protein [Dictyoglomaceae bacterium]